MSVGEDLDPLLHQPARARIMAYLFRNRSASAAQLREALGLTRGNLQSHAVKLTEAGYLDAQTVLAAGLEARYAITDAGAAAFCAYAERLHALLAEAGLDESRESD